VIPRLTIAAPPDRPLRILAIGAHCDDIEIGAAGLILRLAAEMPSVSVRWLVASADEERGAEARVAAGALLESVSDVRLDLRDFRDGYLPYLGPAPKEWLAGHADFAPDVLICPWRGDRHQDHRLLGELAWQVFRDSLVLEYEIPKFEGDLGQPNLFVALDRPTAERKIDVIVDAFRSQHGRRWFDRETFWAMLRLRGLEGVSPSGFAEAFHAAKVSL
jgi:LmbE family N-acetylglucosaminyl deacetylase